MEIITEQIRQTIIKEITEETLDECIKEINKEIEQEKGDSVAYTVSQFYLNGLTKAREIINKIKQEKS